MSSSGHQRKYKLHVQLYLSELVLQRGRRQLLGAGHLLRWLLHMQQHEYFLQHPCTMWQNVQHFCNTKSKWLQWNQFSV